MDDERLPVARAAYGDHPDADTRWSLRAKAERFKEWRERSELREFVVGLVAGPALIAVMWGVGVGIGSSVGFVAACVLLPILVITFGILLGRFTGATTAFLAVMCAAMTGFGAADQYDNIRLAESGDLARHVPLADLPRFAAKKRVTLADANERVDLEETATDVHHSGAASERTTTTFECEAFPIVPKDWRPSTPVRVWRFGDTDFYASHERVYKPASPDELCKKAIARSEKANQLTTAPDAIYLEAKVGDSPDIGANKRNALFALVFMSGFWILTALLIGAKQAIAFGWERLRR